MSGWIISLVVLVVAICAGLAALGFRGRITTIGVDLGTTFSVVGINKNSKVIIIEDKFGHRIFPSIVSYKDNGEIVAAYEAAAELSKRPENTIYNAKRFIGRSLQDEQVQLYANQHSFNVVESSLSNYSQVGFRITATGHESVITPEQVGTQVLKYLLSVTADYLGHDQVNKAVIAVPAKFSALQRQATAEAYRQAGLKVVRVIEEPTAAAVAYKLHKKSDIHHILVYDFGGGTLDVSLLYVASGSVQVYATDGDETLGGSDFDICLYQNIKDKILALTGIDIDSISAADYSIDITSDSGDKVDSKSKSSSGGKKRSVSSNSGGSSYSDVISDAPSEDDMCIVPSIHVKAESAKKAMTTSDLVEVTCVMPKVHNNGETIKLSLSRSVDFEQGCDELFQRGLLPVTRLLEELNMSKEDIDEVVLVGGSTRIPLVKNQLREYFDKELNDHIDPDVTVAYGAASILD